MVNSEELSGTTEYLALCTRCRIDRYRYKRVPIDLVCIDRFKVLTHACCTLTSVFS